MDRDSSNRDTLLDDPVGTAEFLRGLPVQTANENVTSFGSVMPEGTGPIPDGFSRKALLSFAPKENRLVKMSDVTVILAEIECGTPGAAQRLLVLVYDELRRLAAAKMAAEAPSQTLQPTALVHEAWLKLIGNGERKFNDRTHFFRAAAEAMRRILIDRARRKHAQRRGGTRERVDIDDVDLAAPGVDDQLLAVNEALEKFAKEFPLQAELVKLRFFAGMTTEEISKVLDISVSTAKNYWNFSRAWLINEIESS